jgi:hypothetical protein
VPHAVSYIDSIFDGGSTDTADASRTRCHGNLRRHSQWRKRRHPFDWNGTGDSSSGSGGPTLRVNATFSGLTSPTVAAHIHCCAPLGTNVGVATAVPTFPPVGVSLGFPLNVTSGSFTSGVYDLTQPLIYNPAFITLKGSIAAAEAALIAGLEGGMTYFNIHTMNFPGGEIRGQLNAVPLPTALPLFATGLGALGLLSWRRKKKAAALAA